MFMFLGDSVLLLGNCKVTMCVWGAGEWLIKNLLSGGRRVGSTQSSNTLAIPPGVLLTLMEKAAVRRLSAESHLTNTALFPTTANCLVTAVWVMEGDDPDQRMQCQIINLQP